MKKLALITLSTALFFTVQGRADTSQCIMCPDPSIFTTHCTRDGQGYKCWGHGTDASGNEWKGTANGPNGKVPAKFVSCDTFSNNCYIKNLGQPTATYDIGIYCMYSIDSETGTAFWSTPPSNYHCQKPDSHCDPTSNYQFYCPGIS